MFREINILSFSGADTTTTPMNAVLKWKHGRTGSPHNPDPPAVTAVVSNAMSVAGSINNGGSGGGGWTAPSAYTLRSDNTPVNDTMLATKTLSASGSENPGTFTGAASNTVDWWDGFTITLKPIITSTWNTSGQLAVPGGSLELPEMPNLHLLTPLPTIFTPPRLQNDTSGTGTVTYYLANDGSTFSQVTPGSPFTFASTASDLRFKIVLTGNATVQDVSISYTGFSASADLTSSAYNTGSANNLISKLAWSASGVSGAATLKFQIRSAPNNAGVPGTWSNWCGASDTGATCTGSNFFTSSDNNVTIGSSNPLRNNDDDQWFQYKIFLPQTESATATVSSVTVSYVANAPPQF